jgi:hypothetical protein
MAKGHSIDGWFKSGCIEVGCITERIDNLMEESKRRNKVWRYSFNSGDRNIIREYFQTHDFPSVEICEEMNRSISYNPKKLAMKCRSCRHRQNKCKGKETCEDRMRRAGYKIHEA